MRRSLLLTPALRKWQSYTRSLHTKWPEGTVEPLPEFDEGGRISMPGVRIVGDLTGIPLLKFASDSGDRSAQDVAAELAVSADIKGPTLPRAVAPAHGGKHRSHPASHRPDPSRSFLEVKLNYYHAVDIFLAGIFGVGLYFWFRGRAWGRFAPGTYPWGRSPRAIPLAHTLSTYLMAVLHNAPLYCAPSPRGRMPRSLAGKDA